MKLEGGEKTRGGGKGRGRRGGGHNVALLERGRASSLSYEKNMRINTVLAQVVFFFSHGFLFSKLGQGSRLIWWKYLGISDRGMGGGC